MPKVQKPCVTFTFEWSESHFPPLTLFLCRRAETPVSHSLLGESLFPIFSPCCFLSSSLWGNKKLDLPVWKVKKWKIFGTKWAQQALNVQIWIPQIQKPLCLNYFAPAPSFLPLSGVIRNWTSQYKDKVLNCWEQNQFNRLQMVQSECPKVRNPCVSFTFGWFPFPHFQPLASFLSVG